MHSISKYDRRLKKKKIHGMSKLHWMYLSKYWNLKKILAFLQWQCYNNTISKHFDWIDIFVKARFMIWFLFISHHEHSCYKLTIFLLAYQGWNKMATIFPATILSSFSVMKIIVVWRKSHPEWHVCHCHSLIISNIKWWWYKAFLFPTAINQFVWIHQVNKR